MMCRYTAASGDTLMTTGHSGRKTGRERERQAERERQVERETGERETGRERRVERETGRERDR